MRASLGAGSLEPYRIENAGRISHTVEPLNFHSLEVLGFFAGHRHEAQPLIDMADAQRRHAGEN